MEVKEHENKDDIMNTLEECYSSVNVPFNDIDYAHHIGLTFTDKKSEKKNLYLLNLDHGKLVHVFVKVNQSIMIMS